MKRGVLFLLALPTALAQSSLLNDTAYISIAAISLILFIAVLAILFSKPRRLRKKLKHLETLLHHESALVLKNTYIELYHAYLKLKEHHKRRFYAPLLKLRTTLEEQLQAEHSIETKLNEFKNARPHEKRKHYLEIHKTYLNLPTKIQKKYHPHVQRLKESI